MFVHRSLIQGILEGFVLLHDTLAMNFFASVAVKTTKYLIYVLIPLNR
jgi:hypothetical protein